MKKILSILMIGIMVFVFAGCNSEPVTEPDTTQQQITEQQTNAETEEVKFFTREYDESKLMTEEEIRNIKIEVDKESINDDRPLFFTWQEYEDMILYNKQAEEERVLTPAAVLKITVTDLNQYIHFSITDDGYYERYVSCVFPEFTIDEVLKTYNGCEIKKEDDIKMSCISGFSPTNVYEFIESYGGEVIKSTGSKTKINNFSTGFYELKFEKDKEYTFDMYGIVYLTLLEKGEYLVLVKPSYYSQVYNIYALIPWSTPDYKSIEAYKDIQIAADAEAMLTDFYNTFVKK